VSGCFLLPNSPPVARFTCDATSGDSPLLVRFEGGGSSDPDGEIAEYHWDFGNGETTTYNYVTSGIALYITDVARTYVVTLTVTDDDGAQDTATQSISVEPYGGTPGPPSPGTTKNFSGTGQQVTPLFHLSAGRAIFRMTHSGSSNFIIWLEDDTADLVDLLVNEIGSFNGSTSSHIEASGLFMLDIKADGAWTVTIEQ
jgi:PKD repeat protein